jgi:excisionase family DNA binding protein
MLEQQDAYNLDEDEILTTKEVADRLKVSERTVIRYYKRDDLPVHHLPGNVTRFLRKEVNEFFARHRTQNRAS